MVVKVIQRVSIARNGVGAFVFPCKKVTLQYCNWGGSSDGMRRFLTSERLDKFAIGNPYMQFDVLRKPGHPILRAEYTNGREKVICVRNLSSEGIEAKLKLLRDSSGDQLRRWTKNDNVRTLNSSVRGIWSPIHAAKQHKI
ncbi:similar to Saccharomyces cerevisiae YPR100W MRPL51 Mitochondrial ribosomal protein of the large subunit [Maudiozyma barnettii]|uniref:Large ribosomal subunit protein mL43 n=1 Tax=Maudiozyma barnettii TaxID=61262 RepID=A0A8H2ZE88_9SACH|nr:mitochondrial 54S ribosomal protein MRPL51 [Kazachstania barnettii]CAB4252071.1 similar to Saccharomyces cerevisiae YPR100W MRPL51 Mitochondrial ribosomal protein of the large subunit [Kazachstania barnettii]CAD1778559.1 similar to Saccharomyces cerevisiae YPR100W MRPL51 Mitochondrial ribosomal protein of the large subunit [Kazachstania barnettii]